MVPNFTLFVYSRNVKYTLCRLGTPGLKQRVQLAVAQVVREYLEGYEQQVEEPGKYI